MNPAASSSFAITMSSADFTSIPILEYGLLARDRAAFLSQLRHALIHVGFLYLRGAPVDTTSVIAQIPRVFALPQSSKDALSMRNSEHFLGYTNLGTEFTKGALDMREQFDFATPHQNEWTEGDPEYLRLWGPAQVRAPAAYLLSLSLLKGSLSSSGHLTRNCQALEK